MTVYPALPISLYLQDRKVLLVGEGPAADERARRLEAAGAVVERCPRLELGDPDPLRGAFLVIAHSEDDEANRQVAVAARAAGALAYAHDQPGISDFAMPALVRRGNLQIAISTNGTAPSLARRLREEIARALEDAGTAVDALHHQLVETRAKLPRGQRGALYRQIARRLRLSGRFVVAADADADAEP